MVEIDEIVARVNESRRKFQNPANQSLKGQTVQKGEPIISVQITMHTTLSELIGQEAIKVKAGAITERQFIEWLEAADRVIHGVLDNYGGK